MTAEEFLQEHHQISHFYSDKEERMVCFADDVKQAMIEFAKLHVEAALKAASEKAEKQWISDGYSTGMWQEVTDKDSILNAYPKENIQ